MLPDKYKEKKQSIIRVLNELKIEFTTGSWREGDDMQHNRQVKDVYSANIDEIAEKILEKFGIKEKAKFS